MIAAISRNGRKLHRGGVKQRMIEGQAGACAQRSKRVEFRAGGTTITTMKAKGCGIVQADPVKIAFNTENSRAVLPIVPSLAADRTKPTKV